MFNFSLSRALASIATVGMVLLSSQAVRAEIKFGVEDNRGAVAARGQWQQLADFLAEAVGQPVTLVPTLGEKAVEAIGTGQVDIALHNPNIVATARAAHGVSVVATVIQPWGTQFGGLIIAAKGAGITSVNDIRGKKIMAQGASAGGAFLFQRYYLLLKGIDITKDASEIKHVPKQDDIVLAVKAGVFDVGFIRTGVLEDMVKKGKVGMDDFIVIDKIDDGSYPFVRTTPLYPEWCLMAAKSTDPALVAKIKAALLGLKPDSEVSKTAHINGFAEPLSLDPVVSLLTAIKAPYFAQ